MNAWDRISRNPEKFTVYSGQVMLRDYDTDSVNLWLADHGEKSPVEGHKRSPEHPEKGTRYLMVLIEVDDDEQPIDIHLRQKFMDVVKQTVKPLTTPEAVVRQAAMLCRDTDFHRFVNHEIRTFTPEKKAAFVLSGVPLWLTQLGMGSFKQSEHAELWCKYYLYYRCEVTSRKELGFHKDKKEKFAAVLRDFNAWGNKHGSR